METWMQSSGWKGDGLIVLGGEGCGWRDVSRVLWVVVWNHGRVMARVDVSAARVQVTPFLCIFYTKNNEGNKAGPARLY